MLLSKTFSKFENYWFSDPNFRQVAYSQYYQDRFGLWAKDFTRTIWKNYPDILSGYLSNLNVVDFLCGLFGRQPLKIQEQDLFFNFGQKINLEKRWIEFWKELKLVAFLSMKI